MSIECAYWRYVDLKSRGIVNNRMTLYRWIHDHAFPKGVLLGPNSRAWPVEEVIQWLDDRKSSNASEESNA
jgi:hypothetical protein